MCTDVPTGAPEEMPANGPCPYPVRPHPEETSLLHIGEKNFLRRHEAEVLREEVTCLFPTVLSFEMSINSYPAEVAFTKALGLREEDSFQVSCLKTPGLTHSCGCFGAFFFTFSHHVLNTYCVPSTLQGPTLHLYSRLFSLLGFAEAPQSCTWVCNSHPTSFSCILQELSLDPQTHIQVSHEGDLLPSLVAFP